MINRTLIRTKAMLVLYAEVSNNSLETTDPKLLLTEGRNAAKKLLKSYAETYDTYALMLMLIKALTQEAEDRIETARNKYLPTEEEKNPNMRFVNNRFAAQIADNDELNSYARTAHLTWDEQPETVKILLDDIMQQPFYSEYMSAQECGYDEDKEIWKKIFRNVLVNSTQLFEIMEERSLYGASDFDQALDFALKTIKKIKQEDGSEAKLQPIFNDERDTKIGEKIIIDACVNYHQYNDMIEEQLKNWSLDRIVMTDRIVLIIAIAEIMSIPTIPIQVTINEYINLAREYGSDDSHKFINGLLDNISKKLVNERKVMKAVIPRLEE